MMTLNEYLTAAAKKRLDEIERALDAGDSVRIQHPDGTVEYRGADHAKPVN